jgi:hypothetical protein
VQATRSMRPVLQTEGATGLDPSDLQHPCHVRRYVRQDAQPLQPKAHQPLHPLEPRLLERGGCTASRRGLSLAVQQCPARDAQQHFAHFAVGNDRLFCAADGTTSSHAVPSPHVWPYALPPSAPAASMEHDSTGSTVQHSTAQYMTAVRQRASVRGHWCPARE